MKKELRILFFPVGGQEPEFRYVEEDLTAMQNAIGGGFLEVLGLTEDLALYCDEEGLLKQLPFNCFVQRPGEQGLHEIHGPMFILGQNDEGEDVSITPERCAKQIQLLKHPDGQLIVNVVER